MMLNNKNIIEFIEECELAGNDIFLADVTNRFFNRSQYIKLHSIPGAVIGRSYDEYWKKGYEVVRKRITRLANVGLIIKDSDLGRGVILSTPKRINYKLPKYEEFIVWVKEEYPQWFSRKQGGTNKGGGYGWMFEKFYGIMNEYMNNELS